MASKRMTKAEARRRVAFEAALLLGVEADNGWLAEGPFGAELSREDRAMMRAALDDLVDLLIKRSGPVANGASGGRS